ncbi:MAG: fructose-6-phosphate aldolase [Firmicutes bacterium]|nr:fructose-6-phosphate aldolase [Bacillota bacterium]
MEIFLDTANIAEITEAGSWGVLSGVTTNPTLIAAEGKEFFPTIKEICAAVKGPVSAEVIATEAAGMVKEAVELAALATNVVVKIPLITEGLKAIHQLAGRGVATNATLIFSTNQALLAARAGASYVSPFVGRLDDVGHDGVELVAEIAEVFEQHSLRTRIIAGSVRHPLHVVQAARAGAHIATIPFAVLKKMVSHPLTDLGVARFIEDWKKAGLGPVLGG